MKHRDVEDFRREEHATVARVNDGELYTARTTSPRRDRVVAGEVRTFGRAFPQHRSESARERVARNVEQCRGALKLSEDGYSANVGGCKSAASSIVKGRQSVSTSCPAGAASVAITRNANTRMRPNRDRCRPNRRYFPFQNTRQPGAGSGGQDVEAMVMRVLKSRHLRTIQCATEQ